MSSDEEVSLRNCKKFAMERSTELNQNLSQTPVVNPEFFGPVLPPHLLKSKLAENEPKSKIYGPVLPEKLTNIDKHNEHLETESDTEKTDNRGMIGPEMPKHLETLNVKNANISDEDDDTFGPSPTLMATDTTNSYKFVVRRNPNKQNRVESIAKRESWMLELPTKKIGSGQRHFRTRVQTNKDSDQSSWTDTPKDKHEKEKATKEKVKPNPFKPFLMLNLTDVLKKKHLEERDKEMEVLAKKAAKKLRKEKSLLEIHRKNLKKKRKETKKQRKSEKQAVERRPFDRNIDLQIHKFDESQKKAILSKARFLNDRFASGESKFL